MQADTATMIGTGRDLAEFGPEGFGKRVLYKDDSVFAVLAGFRAGQEISAHAPGVNLVVSVLDGGGRIRAGEEVRQVSAGDVAVIPAGQVRAIQAGEDGMVLMNVVSPPPTDADHAILRPEYTWPAEG